MAWSVTDLGADILLFEQLLDFALCNHIIQIAECCKFEAAGIELETVKTQIRSNELLYLSEENSLLKSTNQLLIGRVAIIQQLLHQHYGVKFTQAETCSILRSSQGSTTSVILIIYYCRVAWKKWLKVYLLEM